MIKHHLTNNAAVLTSTRVHLNSFKVVSFFWLPVAKVEFCLIVRDSCGSRYSLKLPQHRCRISLMETCCLANQVAKLVFDMILLEPRWGQGLNYGSKSLKCKSPQSAWLKDPESVFGATPGNSACTISLCNRRAGTALGLRMSWPDQLSTQQKCLLRIVYSFLTQGSLAWLASRWSDSSVFSPQ